MASQFALRPLLRASRPSFRHIARITTTAPSRAATTTTTTTTTAKKPAFSSTSKFASKAAAPSDASTGTTRAATATPSADTGPLPEAPPTSYANGTPTPSTYDGPTINWAQSYHGLGTQRFPKEVVDVLLQPVNPADVEVKPDGIIYLPEIKYRRILNTAFGPGGWGLVPKGEVVVGEKIVTREYALVADGRFISQAQGENGYFALEGLPSAVEGCKSNALMRCCKDLGIASELWDPVFIRQFKKDHADEVWVEHTATKKRKMIWTRKDVPVSYPFKKV